MVNLTDGIGPKTELLEEEKNIIKHYRRMVANLSICPKPEKYRLEKYTLGKYTLANLMGSTTDSICPKTELSVLYFQPFRKPT